MKSIGVEIKGDKKKYEKNFDLCLEMAWIKEYKHREVLRESQLSQSFIILLKNPLGQKRTGEKSRP